MESYKVLERKITADIDGRIKAVNEGNELNEPVYAINWFNTKMEWMYNFYNILAASSLFKVGGSVFFKGKVTQTIHGNRDAARELLLVVNYPAPDNFLDLMQIKFFQLISIFRILSVDKFTFGFTERKDDKPRTRLDKSKSHAVHHFKFNGGDNPDAVIQNIKELAEKEKVEIIFIGKISSLLFIEKNSHEAQVPCLMDVVVIFEGDMDEALEHLLSSKEYVDLAGKQESTYSALVNRVM